MGILTFLVGQFKILLTFINFEEDHYVIEKNIIGTTNFKLMVSV